MTRAERLSAALSKPHAVSALVSLLDEPGISAAKLARLMGANQPSTGRVMAKHLASFGLASIKKVPGPFKKSATAISLTATGEKLARGLARLQLLL